MVINLECSTRHFAGVAHGDYYYERSTVLVKLQWTVNLNFFGKKINNQQWVEEQKRYVFEFKMIYKNIKRIQIYLTNHSFREINAHTLHTTPLKICFVT